MIRKYISFLSKSTNQHGVHSPFVYKLITECIYKKSPVHVVENYELIISKLKKNDEVIHITDFGKGSKVFKNNKRKISSLVKVVGISKKYGLLLNRIINHLQINQVLELGTSVGLSTISMCINNKDIEIDTIEGCSTTLNIAKNQFDTYEFKNNVKCHLGNFNEELLPLVSAKKYDLVYFDGNHEKEATLKYFEQCLQTKHNDTVFIFDDIYWSDQMEEAWNEIKNHSEVTVTIDLFQWGIVFFRKEQEKEHFKIRF